MENTNKINYELEQFYPGFDRQKFFDLFVNHEAWTESEFMPGKVSIIKPGKDHPLGLGAVRAVDSGRMIIEEDPKNFGAGWIFKYVFRSVHKSAFRDLEKAYKAYYNI